jgi:hypothetical protein
MKKNIMRFLLVLFSLVFLVNSALSSDNKNLQVKKQPELQQIKPKKPIKIKLKHSADGKYTWDLTGDDVDDIVRADKRLKKLLGIE